MDPAPSGSVTVSPARSGRGFTSTRRIFAASSLYTDCGTPESSPRSPLNGNSATIGLSGAGKAETVVLPVLSGAAVGQNRPMKPSWDGCASGTLMTPSEANVRSSFGRNGTEPWKATLPLPSLTVNVGAY